MAYGRPFNFYRNNMLNLPTPKNRGQTNTATPSPIVGIKNGIMQARNINSSVIGA